MLQFPAMLQNQNSIRRRSNLHASVYNSYLLMHPYLQLVSLSCPTNREKREILSFLNVFFCHTDFLPSCLYEDVHPLLLNLWLCPLVTIATWLNVIRPVVHQCIFIRCPSFASKDAYLSLLIAVILCQRFVRDFTTSKVVHVYEVLRYFLKAGTLLLQKRVLNLCDIQCVLAFSSSCY